MPAGIVLSRVKGVCAVLSPSIAVRRAAVLTVLVVALVAVFANTAVAAPTEPTLSVAELRAALDASPSGKLPAKFKTVMKGYTVVEVDAEIVAVVTDTPSTSLVLFTSSGDPVQGGIASGMSGSPLYVDDAGTYKLVGAVAYAGDFALGGAGLATPVEDMAKIETASSAASASLERPVIAGRSVVDRVILTDEPELYSGEAAAGAMVAHPLSTTFIGGVKPMSGAYKLLSAALTARGLRPQAMTSSGVSSAALPDQTMGPGASVAALVATGDAWVGGVGTATYRNGDNLLAFGHPLYGLGATSMFLTDAWVDGAWKSSMSSFKFASPSSASRGAFTQDRTAGALAKIGQDVPVTSVTSHAKRLTSSSATLDETSTAVTFSRQLFNAPLGFTYLGSGAAAIAGTRLYDSTYSPGSALTTTTVVVSDGTATHRIQLVNIVDDASDITVATTSDITFALSELLTVYDAGLYADKLSIQSVDLDAVYSPKRRLAYITDIEAPNGLAAGNNLVRIRLLQYGVETPVVIEKMLTIPAGSTLAGRLMATCSNDLAQGSSTGSNFSSVIDEDSDSGSSGGATVNRRTIAQIVSDVNDSYAFNDLIVRLAPSTSLEDESSSQTATGTVETSSTTPYYLQGSVSKTVSSLKLSLAKTTIAYGGTATLKGELSGPEVGASIDIYATPVGEAERRVATVTTAYGETEIPAFTAAISGLQKNTKLRAVFKGSDSAVLAEKIVTVKVSAKASVTSSAKKIKKNKAVKLTAKVSPAATAGGKVVFEYYSKRYRSWKTLATRTLSAKGSRAETTYTWKIKKKGTWRVRVRTVAGSTNAAGTSGSVTIKVK